jgi:hypothetical protein
MEVVAAQNPSPALVARLTAADARLMRSMKTLAAIARLERRQPRPVRATQVNINVAPPATPVDPPPESSSLPDF